MGSDGIASSQIKGRFQSLWRRHALRRCRDLAVVEQLSACRALPIFYVLGIFTTLIWLGVNVGSARGNWHRPRVSVAAPLVNFGHRRRRGAERGGCHAAGRGRPIFGITANLNLLHNLFDLRSHGRPEFLLRFRRQMKAVGPIGRDDRAGVKEGCATKARNAFVEL